MTDKYLLNKAQRFLTVAGDYINHTEYKDIVAFNVHMALELSLNFVIEGLLQDYKYPMYSAYKREFPVQSTHNLSHVCYVLSSYVDFPTYLTFAVLQMSGWCVNSRYAEDFTKTVEQKNLLIIYNAISRFLGTLNMLTEVKIVDESAEELGCKGKISCYKGKQFVASETKAMSNDFVNLTNEYSEILNFVVNCSQEDSKFICSFMNCLEFTNFKQVIAKLIQHRDTSASKLKIIREGFEQLHIHSYEDFCAQLGRYARSYGITETEYNAIVV